MVTERTMELVQKNQELGRLSNFRGEVLQVLGHELRTPLAILAGYHHLNLQAMSYKDTPIAISMGESIERLQQKVERSLELLRGSGRTRFPLNVEEINPAELARGVADRLSPLIRHREVEITCGQEGPPGPCHWDRDKTEAVLEELLVNAVRASPDHSRVVIRISSGEGVVEIQVTDQGRGIPEEQLEHVFEPFITLGDPIHHSSGTFEQGAKGIGIGLSTARMWVQLQQGTITARNNSGGPGCTLVVRLPVRVTPES